MRSGFVSDASGLPVPNAWVHIQPGEDAAELEVAEDERMREHLRQKFSVKVQTDARGHFESKNVNPVSSLAISVRHPKYGELGGESFPVTSGEEISGLQLSFPETRWQ